MASKRRLRRKGCTGKNVYDRVAAESAAWGRRQATGENIRAYRCPFGDHWHIGHRTAQVRWV